MGLRFGKTKKIDLSKLTAREITSRFHTVLGQKHYESCYPNVVLDEWGEFDILGFRKSGFADEFEVKISRSDFKQDFKKTCYFERRGTDTRRKHKNRARNKHDCLLSGDCLPNYFWFVTPKGLIDPDDIPSYAGLIEVSELGIPHFVKSAPRLHSHKLDDQRRYYIARKLSFRYWEVMKKSF